MEYIYRVCIRERYHESLEPVIEHVENMYFKRHEDAVSYMLNLFDNRKDYKTHFDTDVKKEMVHIGNSYEEGFEGDWVEFDYIYHNDINIFVRINVIEEELN